MARHIVTADQLNKWLSKHWAEFAASCGMESNKRLEVSLDGRYRVLDHSEEIYRGSNKLTAIAKYNAAE